MGRNANRHTFCRCVEEKERKKKKSGGRRKIRVKGMKRYNIKPMKYAYRSARNGRLQSAQYGNIFAPLCVSMLNEPGGVVSPCAYKYRVHVASMWIKFRWSHPDTAPGLSFEGVCKDGNKKKARPPARALVPASNAQQPTRGTPLRVSQGATKKARLHWLVFENEEKKRKKK